MPDLSIVKSNVAKMVSMGAPESDIDSYIQGEGTSIDAIKNFNKQPDSVATQGIGYVAQHPFKTAFQGLPETLTGKTLEKRVLDASPKVNTFTPQQREDYKSKWGIYPSAEDQISLGNQFKAMGAGAIDMATAPANALIGPAFKVAGAGLEAIGQGTTNVGRYFSRIKSTFDPKAIENLNVPSSARIANLADISKNSAQADIKPLEENIANTQNKTAENLQNINYQSKDLTLTTRSAVQESRRVLKQNLAQLKTDLQSASEKGAVDFQKKLPDFFSANSEAYGNARDAAIAKMAANNDGMTHQQVFDAIARTKQDIEAALIPPDAPAVKIINQLEAKYAPKTSGSQSGILDASGNPIIQELPNNGNSFVDPNQLIQDLRNVKSSLSAGAKSGRTGFNQEDLAVGYLDHNLGDFIKAKVPGFAKLQEDYTPVIRAMKQAHIIFKPNQGEFNTATATNFLKKAGTGKLEAGQEKLLETIEGGTKFSPGVGRISQPIKEVGQKIQQTVSKSNSQIDNLQTNLRSALEKLDKQKRNITGSSQAEIAQKQATIKSRQEALQKRLIDLDKRKQEVTKLESNKKAAKNIIKAIGGVAGVGGAWETYKAVKK